jgi:lipopolysaccharide export system permease protein
MRRITRYVVSDFLKVFCITLTAMTMVLVFGVVGQEAVREGLSLVNVLRLMPYALPIALLYAIPGTTLFAACSVYGRMSAANEVTAIRSLGLTPIVLLRPVLVVAFVLSVAVVWLNDLAVSWGRTGTQRVIFESVEQIAYGILRARRSYGNDRFSINVKDVVEQRLIRPMVSLQLSKSDPPMVFSAEEAVLRCAPATNHLKIFLTNGEMTYGETHGVFPDTQVIDVPLWAAAGKAGDSQRPSDTALRDIPQQIEDEQEAIRQLDQLLASDAAIQMTLGDFASLADERWRQHHADREARRTRIVRLRTEPWRRWANGFSCLAFVMVGAPLAVRFRNSDVWTSFAACFLPILAVYYPLLAYGVKLAKAGDLPPYCVWIGNLVFLAIGILLIRKVVQR